MTAAEIRAWTAANLRARQEYAEHPFARTGCDETHACAWRYQKRAEAARKRRGGTRGQGEANRAADGVFEKGSGK